jgi:hypothetical protein
MIMRRQAQRWTGLLKFIHHFVDDQKGYDSNRIFRFDREKIVDETVNEALHRGSPFMRKKEKRTIGERPEKLC